MSNNQNLMTALLDEIERNAKLVEIYRSIGAPGMVGATLIQLDVDQAKAAIASMDVVEMLRCYQTLKENEA